MSDRATSASLALLVGVTSPAYLVVAWLLRPLLPLLLAG